MSARSLTILGLSLWLAAALLRGPAAPTSSADALPPQVAVAKLALGGLSPLLVDLLWLRAAEQQEAGQYFAMAATMRQVALLQPNGAGLFVFEARNLAFSVSGEFDDPGLRWSWVRRGLRLLATDGLQAQPDEPAIDENIATILLGRVADRYDPGSVGDRLHWAHIWQDQVVAGRDGRYGLRSDLDLERWAEWGLSVDRVRAVDSRFGPFDWRTPEAHAVYWTTEAIRKAGGEARRPIAARMRYQALWASFQGGRMILAPDTGRLELLPDSRLIAPLSAEMARLGGVLPNDGELPIARANMDRDAVLVLYLEGQGQAALSRLGPDAGQAALEDTVLTAAGLEPNLPPDVAADLVTGWLATSIRLREVGAADLARGWERVAQLACERREQLPPFEQLMSRALSEGK